MSLLCVSRAPTALLGDGDAVEEMIEQALEDGSNTFSFNHRHEATDIPSSLAVLRDQLEVLHVDNNYSMSTLSTHITGMSRLRWLNASYGALTSIDPSLGRLSKLERLTLNNNALSWLPMEVWQLKELQELNLENNKLKVLPDGLLFLPKLRVATLENNPLYMRAEVEGAAAATFVPPQRSVDCSGCCTRTRYYQVFVSFHTFVGQVEVPFVHFACSETCVRHVRSRLETYDATH